MEIKLKLYNRTGLFDIKSVIVPKDEKLFVKLEGKTIMGLTYFAKTKEMVNPIEIKNGMFEIKNTSSGFYDFVISATRNGEVLRTWECESLIIKDLGDKNEFKAEFSTFKEDILNEINELKERVVLVEKKSENTLEVVKKLNGLNPKVVK